MKNGNGNGNGTQKASGGAGDAQRVVIGMIDGFGPDYLRASPMPNLGKMIDDGWHATVPGMFPSITNVNNVSIVCGAFPDEHGITGNSYFDEASGRAEYMNAGEMIRSETIFRRAARRGVKSALLTSKRKSVELFAKDCDLAVAAETPPADLVALLGEPGPIYSREINDWLWKLAAHLLRTRPDLGLLYVHTTDYPMHRWPAEARESKDHLAALDARIGECRDAAPDAAFLFTADHGMNAKVRNWDLVRVCREAGVPIRFALSPERDYYVAHHRNYTGCAFVWLRDRADEDRVATLLARLEGVESVLPAAGAARRWRTIESRLGDLVVLGDRETMFGDADELRETLPPTYRAHGSLHEMTVPVIAWNLASGLPDPDDVPYNKDLARSLYV